MTNTHTLVLTNADFTIDTTSGAEMAVENDWHYLDPIDVSENLDFYDSEHTKLDKTRYAIVPFYKIAVPACFMDPTTYNTKNPLSSRYSMNDGNTVCTNGLAALGTPFRVFTYGYNWEMHFLTLNKTTGAYALPASNLLNRTNIANSAFAEGSYLANFNQGDNFIIPKAVSWNQPDNGRYLFMTASGPNDTPPRAVKAYIEHAQGGGGLSYTVSTDGNLLNVPTDSFYDNKKYLMPKLFQPYMCLTCAGGTGYDPQRPNDGWDHNSNSVIIFVLGVKEIPASN